MAEVQLRQVSKSYDGETLSIQPLDISIKDKEFIVIVGPSGCGKSTTLRMIAGLEEITGGSLFIDGELVNHVEPKDRDIAMVFQNYALYPHMTIYDNIGFSLKMQGENKEVIDRKVREVASVLELEEYLDRKPAALSGGQRQRVALGRAMVRNPKVFLLDEPLSNLDAKLRVAMRAEIVELHKKLETTFIYVTHDQTEAMTMGDRIVILRDGVLEQMDTPIRLYKYPASKFVGEFIGSPQMNVFQTTLNRTPDGATIKFNGKEIPLGEEIVNRLKEEVTPGLHKVYAGMRLESFRHLSEPTENSITVKAKAIENMGHDSHIFFTIQEKETPLIVRAKSDRGYQVGDDMTFAGDPNKWYLFDYHSEQTLLETPENEFE